MAGILLPYLGLAAQQALNIAPNQLPNLNLWYDSSIADATRFSPVPTNGGAVEQWLSLTGVGRNANQNTGTRQPAWRSNQQNGLGTIQFDGTSDVLTLNPIDWALSLSGQTTYLVTKPVSLTGTPRITVTNTGGFQFFWDTYWGIETAGGRAKSANTGSTANYVYMGMILDGTQTNPDITTQNNLRLKMRINGVTETLTFSANVGTATSAAANTFYVGSDGTGPAANYYSGYVAELLIWTRTLSSTEITQVETYLANKWNIF